MRRRRPGGAGGAIDAPFVDSALTVSSRRFDKGGDHFYDQISALHKSVRGSHPDAALYWLTRMLDGGADPYLARRIVRMAWEDIGLADPRHANRQRRRLDLRAAGQPGRRAGTGPAVIYLAIAAKEQRRLHRL